MSESQAYWDQLESIASWGQWEDQRRRRWSRQVRSRIEEIRAGAVMPDEDAPGCWLVEVSTASGSRRFRNAREVHEGDIQSEPILEIWRSEFYPILVKHLAAITGWLSVEDRRSTTTGVVSPLSMTLFRSNFEQHSFSLDSSSNGLLNVLKNTDTSREEYRKAIVNAEILDFGPSETRELTPLLRGFIEQYRNSNVPAQLVAVGSAIRKFIAVASGSEAFDFAAVLLKAGGRAPLSIEIEVEVSKMVLRKLTSNPPPSRDQYPDLGACLAELAETYLSPRLLAREKHGAVALNAVLGLVLTREPRAAEIVERVQGLGVKWFQQLVARQATTVRSDLIRRWGDDLHAELLQSLEELSVAASPIPSN
jgi:hypothetical protein